MKKTIYLFILNFLFNSIQGQITQGSSGKFGTDTLQTSDILEIHKGKKFKAIFFEDKISIHYLHKISGDTIYYKIITGEFMLFKHDSITRKDSLILKSNTTQTYYFVNNNNSIKTSSTVTKSAEQKATVEFTSISKILIGRKIYKLKPTKDKELVWSLGV